MSKKKVIIIGAGPAGLTCAYKLLENNSDYEITILEQDNLVGGISKTVTYNGNRMDLGGHRFFSKNQEINKIWQEILPLDTNKNEANSLLIRKRVSRIYYKHNFFDYPVTINYTTIKNLGFKNTIISGFSYIKSIIIKKKETNLENFYINRFGKKLYSLFFEKYTEKVWGRNPKNISADWGSQRVKGLSIIKILATATKKIFHIKDKNLETSLIENFYYPKYGPGSMWEEMAKVVQNKGVKILKNATVVKIEQKNKKIISVSYNKDGNIIKLSGDIFISSMPLKKLIEITNDIPKKIINIASNLPYRDFITVGLIVKKLNLKSSDCNKKLVPDCWLYIQEPDIKMGRIQIFNNWSPYLVKNANKNVSIGLEYFCNENDDMWNMTEEAFINFAISELIKMSIIDENSVIDSHLERVKKAYPAYFDSYSEIDKLISYINKYDNLYCIGRNGQHRYNNMDHSMLTAIETVKNIINNKKDKSNIWNVNTENSYGEEQYDKK